VIARPEINHQQSSPPLKSLLILDNNLKKRLKLAIIFRPSAFTKALTFLIINDLSHFSLIAGLYL
jgi:hypothetical protein